MRPFSEIYATACLHKGGERVVESRLPSCKSTEELYRLPDSAYLSAISLRIFRAGLKHSLVDSKWSAFEEVFKSFEPAYCAHLSDEFFETCMSNTALIRHFGKLKTIRTNAQLLLIKRDDYGSFGRYVADWPTQNIIGLWTQLKKQGAHLGGGSAAAFLRMVGKDTFMLTDDVVSVLKLEGVVTKAPTSQRDLKAVQDAFNCWRAQSGRSLCEVSRIISLAAV